MKSSHGLRGKRGAIKKDGGQAREVGERSPTRVRSRHSSAQEELLDATKGWLQSTNIKCLPCVKHYSKSQGDRN